MTHVVINERWQIPWSEITWTSVRSQGPGGQHVNKTSTKVVMRWNAKDTPSLPADVIERLLARPTLSIGEDGWVTVTSQKYRRRQDNLRDCVEKLRGLVLAVAHRPKKRRATKPTLGSQRRRRQAKEILSSKKRDRQANRGDSG